jgi:hypothetical protein
VADGRTTPIANQWLVTEIIIVPIVGKHSSGLVFFAPLCSRRISSEKPANLSILLSDAFGLLHANNLFAGVPIGCCHQVLNACI